MAGEVVSARRGDDLERRTVKVLTDLGYRAERVSRRGRYGTRDLFGVVDIIAIGADGLMLAQVTTKNNASSHRRKIRDARLMWPVRLFMWSQGTNRRWTFVSEEIEPAEGAA